MTSSLLVNLLIIAVSVCKRGERLALAVSCRQWCIAGVMLTFNEHDVDNVVVLHRLILHLQIVDGAQIANSFVTFVHHGKEPCQVMSATAIDSSSLPPLSKCAWAVGSGRTAPSMVCPLTFPDITLRAPRLRVSPFLLDKVYGNTPQGIISSIH